MVEEGDEDDLGRVVDWGGKRGLRRLLCLWLIEVWGLVAEMYIGDKVLFILSSRK